jgi:ion channel-forming bestrophin family protein
MILYNSKNWSLVVKNVLGFGYAYNTRELFKFQGCVLLYTIVIAILRIHVFPKTTFDIIHIDITFLSLVGVIMGLTLVFRTNSSYDRWWEGRKQWGSLINESRTLASNFHCLIPKEDHETRHYVASQIANFAYALKGHLRDSINPEYFDYKDDSYLQELNKSKHIPHKIATLIFEKMQELYIKGVFSDMDKINIKHQIEQFINVMGACERIKNSPIPFSHVAFIKSFIIFYCLFLPVGLIDKFQYYTIPAVFLISYALAGVEVISEEIEQPFGTDSNDLPLRHMCNVIKQNVYDILEVPMDKKLPSAVTMPSVII